MSEKALRTGIIIGAIVIVSLLFIFRNRIFRVLLSAEQELYIRNLHPKVQDKFRRFIRRVENETGYSVIITDGNRSYEDQLKEHNADPTNVPKPGGSLHGYGMAIDINATNGTTYLRKSSSIDAWNKSGIPQIAKEMGFKWGGDYLSYHDPIHFDLGNDYDIDYLIGLAQSQFGSDWQKMDGNKIRLT